MSAFQSSLNLNAICNRGHEGKQRCESRSKAAGPPPPPPGTRKRLTGDWDRWRRRSAFLLLAVGMLSSQPSHAISFGGKKQKRGKEGSTDELLGLGWPIAKNLGLSGILGVIAAVAFKAVGRGLALIIGAAFAVIQLGVYLGYVKVDWTRVHKDVSTQVSRQQTRFHGHQSEADKLVAQTLAIMSQASFCLPNSLLVRNSVLPIVQPAYKSYN